MNLPNQLTIARCFMAVIFVGLMSFEHVGTYFAAFVIFIAAVITDYYDGKIARERNLVTNFGKLLDPVADKVLMVAGFVMLLTLPEIAIPAWAVVAIFAREFLVTGARALAASEGEIIPANWWGKIKTIVQMAYVGTFVFLAFFLQALRTWPRFGHLFPGDISHYVWGIGWASFVAVIGVSVFTVLSGVQFTVVNWKRMKIVG
jgi:CDP-diacylglycerol---glycerol-3-phosphate 3-phosphatidyltransferase